MSCFVVTLEKFPEALKFTWQKGDKDLCLKYAEGFAERVDSTYVETRAKANFTITEAEEKAGVNYTVINTAAELCEEVIVGT